NSVQGFSRICGRTSGSRFGFGKKRFNTAIVRLSAHVSYSYFHFTLADHVFEIACTVTPKDYVEQLEKAIDEDRMQHGKKPFKKNESSLKKEKSERAPRTLTAIIWFEMENPKGPSTWTTEPLTESTILSRMCT